MNKRLLFLAATASFAMAGAAAQAQSTDRADWSGPYIGVNGGYNWANTTDRSSNITVNQLTGVNAGAGPVTTAPTSFPSGGDMKNNGWSGGGQLGFNVQSGPLVWGLEGDFDGVWASHGETMAYTLPATGLTTGSTVTVNRSANPNWMATVRGRLGFGLDRMLIYGTGGVAFADLRDRASYSYAPTVTGAVATANPGVTYGPYASSGGSSGIRTGWTAGGGVDFLVSNNMTIGAEYRHTEIGGADRFYGSTSPNGVSEHGRLGFADDAVLGRINFKFSSFGHMF